MKSNGKPADCICGYPETIADNGSLHAQSCPVYARWVQWVKLGGRSEIEGVTPISTAPMYIVGIDGEESCQWGLVGVFDTQAMAERCCVSEDYWYACLSRNLMYMRELRPDICGQQAVSVDHAGAMRPGKVVYPRREGSQL